MSLEIDWSRLSPVSLPARFGGSGYVLELIGTEGVVSCVF